MERKKFNKKEIGILSQNENVKRCGENSLTYTNAFKIEAVKQYNKGLTANQIFEEIAGFDLKIIGTSRARSSLKEWNKQVRKEGLQSLKKDKRSKRKKNTKPKDKTPKDRLERLEAENAYLKEENAFLAKLRAKR